MKRTTEKTVLVVTGGLAAALLALAYLVACIYEIGHWKGIW